MNADIENAPRRPRFTLNPTSLVVFSTVVVVVSMPWSPFLLSVGMWGMVIGTFWHRLLGARALEGNLSLYALLWRSLVRSFIELFRCWPLALLVLLLLIPLLSGLWSDDKSFWLERVRVRLPFLVLPWAFANMPPLRQRYYNSVVYALVWTMVVLGLGVCLNYLLHEEQILDGIEHGKPIPVPRHHIRFSLIVATAILGGGWLWGQRFIWRYKWERPLLGAAVLFLVGFLHFLAVRSGLAAFYAGIIFGAAHWAWSTRRWEVALAGLAGLLLVAGLAFWAFPSMQEKWSYVRYDWQQYQHEDGANYSDAERWVSLQVGWMLWKEHPWIGVGTGDLPQQMKQKVAEHFPEHLQTYKLPHNQFLYIMSSTGLLGLVGSLLAWGGLLFSQKQRFWLFSVFQVMLLTSCMVEYTIETSAGVAWALFYSLWFWMQGHERE